MGWHTCGIDAGKLYCWGVDSNGQIGNGATTGDVISPTQIGTSTTWQYISAGSYHTHGIDANILFGFGYRDRLLRHNFEEPYMITMP